MRDFSQAMVALVWWAGGVLGRAILALPTLVSVCAALALAALTSPVWLGWLAWEWRKSRHA